MPTNIQSEWFGGPKADLGDPINQSLRFIRANKTCLTKTLSQAGNRQTWTFSTWFKKAPHTYNYRIFTGGNTAGGSTFTSLMLQGDNTIRFYSYNGASVIHNYVSTHEFGDASGWYHMVVAYDTTNATAADRIQIYINGARITDWSTETHPSQNYNSYIGVNGDGLNVGTYIGGTSNSNSDNYIEGYLAETVFIDGSQLAPTEFGRTNEDGVWVNKTYNGTYSGNSFRLVYNSSAGLGDDSSGLGNDFTANNFETTALSASNFDNDIDYEDTPTNNFPTQNPHIKQPSSLTHSEGLLKNVDSNGSYPNADPATQILKGKKYWEVELVDTAASYPYIGICKAEDIQNGGSWYSSGGGAHYFHGGGYYGWVSNPTNTIGNTTSGDVLGIAFDRDTRECTFTRNGGTGQTVTAPAYDGEFCPMLLNAVSEICKVNYGQRAFRYTPPTGYTAICTNNESEPAIKDPRKHFEIVTYTGDGNDDRNITGLAFAPDFVWQKSTNAANNWGMYDTCRGATTRQTSSTNIADDTLANDLQAFNSDGFQIGSSGRVNSNGTEYKAFCWKAGGAPTATNSAGAGNVPTAGSVKIDNNNLTTALAGTIAAEKLSANTTAGFSIVNYTGTGSNATVAHGLTQAPDLVFYKIRTSTNGWCVYSFRTPNNYMQLNNSGSESSASVTFNNTAPTDSVLHIGSSVLTNGNTSDYLAYCWHSVPGFSKIGDYRGNGSTDGNYIYTDFKPQFLLLKSTSTSQNWVWYDIKGHENNPVDRYAYANLTDSENSSTTTEVDFYANGFKFRSSHNMLNQSGIYFLYMAFAENPFGGENTAPATAR